MAGWEPYAYGGNFHGMLDQYEWYGPWGQAYHGFVHDGMFNVMYPAKDKDDFGVIRIARRPWDKPFGDTFRVSGHACASVSPMLSAYRDATVTMEFAHQGTVGVVLDYAGEIGPHRHHVADFYHNANAVIGHVLEIKDTAWAIVRREAGRGRTVLAEGCSGAPVVRLRIEKRDGRAACYANDAFVAECPVSPDPRPFAVWTDAYSAIDCTRMEVEGEAEPYRLTYNAHDALLGAGEDASTWKMFEGDALFHGQEGYVGSGKAKWNFIGRRCRIWAPRLPEGGTVEIFIDGRLAGTLALHADTPQPSAVLFESAALEHGKHFLVMKPLSGNVVLDQLEAEGKATQVF